MTIAADNHALPFGNQSPPVTYGRLLDFTDDPISCMRALYERHGHLAVLQEGTQRIVFVFGPVLNQRVLSDTSTYHSRFFTIRGSRRSAQRRLTSGIMSMNGEEHKEHRRIVMGPFQKRNIANYHEPICDLTRNLLDSWQPGETRDIHEEMKQHMLRVMTALLFGVDIPEIAQKVGGMIDRWVTLNHEAGMGAFVSNATITNRYERLMALADELEADIRMMIDFRRSSARQHADVLSLLIHAHEQLGSVNDDQLIGHAALLFGAAHLTTANTLTWTLFLLAQYPSIMRKVHSEITNVLSGDAPNLDELLQMPVTESVLRESMRILPASSYSPRITALSAQLGPLDLPAGIPVIFSQFITHHLPELYPDPEQFRPDRWFEIAPSPYAYLPFGAGPKMCVGAPLAMMTLKTVLPTILKRYRLSVVANSEISGRVISTMLGPVTGLPMHISDQDGRFQASPVTGNIHRLVRLDETPAGLVRKAA